MTKEVNMKEFKRDTKNHTNFLYGKKRSVFGFVYRLLIIAGLGNLVGYKHRNKNDVETISTKSADRIATPSEHIIPAVPGEFYSYTSDFSIDRPLYFLMKCKANKSRPLATDVRHIVQELDLTFVFGNEVLLCSPNSTLSLKLLGSIISDPQKLNNSEIRVATITEDTFYDCYNEKKKSFLVDIHHNSRVNESSVVLSKGLILSVKTSSGKYCLILVKEITPSTCKVDACHILL
jgi:hypothetical protein